MPNEIRADMLKVKNMVSEVEMIIGKREGETELVNKLIDAQNLLTYCMSRLENAIVPPCMGGDTVWFVFFGKIYPHIIRDFKITKYGLFACSSTFNFNFTEFGVSVFLTREEAKRELNRRADNG